MESGDVAAKTARSAEGDSGVVPPGAGSAPVVDAEDPSRHSAADTPDPLWGIGFGAAAAESGESAKDDSEHDPTEEDAIPF